VGEAEEVAGVKEVVLGMEEEMMDEGENSAAVGGVGDEGEDVVLDEENTETDNAEDA